MQTKMISIAKEFTQTPAGRYVTDGPYSGEKFREEVLVPALRSDQLVEIDLDGVLGFGSSFLEEAFGGLVRVGFNAKDLRKRLRILSSMKIYEDRVWRYIDEEAARSTH
jgi:hypothetical protein